MTGLLIGIYAGLVLLTTDVLSFHAPVAVAVSTLAAAALFNPLRQRVQHIVDRRFNRARYDADETVTAFSARLNDVVDPRFRPRRPGECRAADPGTQSPLGMGQPAWLTLTATTLATRYIVMYSAASWQRIPARFRAFQRPAPPVATRTRVHDSGAFT